MILPAGKPEDAESTGDGRVTKTQPATDAKGKGNPILNQTFGSQANCDFNQKERTIESIFHTARPTSKPQSDRSRLDPVRARTEEPRTKSDRDLTSLE